MGFFNKLKENFNHGGVKIQIQAPASISMNDATMPVTVTVTASSEQQTIDVVSVTIQAQSFDKGFSQGNSLNQAPQSQQITMARADYAQPFTLMPGESKDVQVNVVINQGAAMAEQLPQDGAMAQVAGMLQKIQSISEVMNDDSYQYFVEARAKVEGIAFGADVRQPLQILKPGQFGGAIQKNIHF